MAGKKWCVGGFTGGEAGQVSWGQITKGWGVWTFCLDVLAKAGVAEALEGFQQEVLLETHSSSAVERY